MNKEYELFVGPETIILRRGATTVRQENDTVLMSGPEGIAFSRLGVDGTVIPESKVLEKVYAWLAERGEVIVWAYSAPTEPLHGMEPVERDIVVTRVLADA